MTEARSYMSSGVHNTLLGEIAKNPVFGNLKISTMRAWDIYAVITTEIKKEIE